MHFEDDGKSILLDRYETDALLRHLKQFERLVAEFEVREKEGRLSNGWDVPWRELKDFLQAEELKGSEIPEADAADGLYCCQLRSRGLTSGRRECHQYIAWYIFAWGACVARAVASRSNATLVAGPCSQMQGCP